MDVINDTAYALEVSRAQLFYEDLIMSTVICKCAWSITPDRILKPIAPPEIFHEDTEIDGHTIDGDVFPVKQGCDFAIVGEAHAPGGRPVPSMRVEARVGNRSSAMKIYGDRVWVPSSRGGFVASDPIPFTTMPLTYARAFGGRCPSKHEGFQDLHPPNPDGCGYASDPETVASTRLPNVEIESQLIGDWRERPPVAGWGPVARGHGLRGARGIDVNIEAQTTHLEPLAFNCAHPWWMLDEYPAGTPVQIAGLDPEGVLAFTLPKLELHVELALAERKFAFPIVVDTVLIFASKRELWISARCAFVYQFRPERLRTITVREGVAPQQPRLRTLGALRKEPDPNVPVAPPADSPFITPALLAGYPLLRIIDRLPVCPSP